MSATAAQVTIGVPVYRGEEFLDETLRCIHPITGGHEHSGIATERVGDPLGSAALGYEWTAEFNRAMDRLAFNAGLLK